jgi:hypothetical protein
MVVKVEFETPLEEVTVMLLGGRVKGIGVIEVTGASVVWSLARTT